MRAPPGTNLAIYFPEENNVISLEPSCFGTT
jgi:hypothetical protein